MLHCSWVFFDEQWISHHKKQQRAASYKPVVMPQLMVGPTSAKLRYEHYQTIIFVTVDKPHLQPQYQTAPNLQGCLKLK